MSRGIKSIEYGFAPGNHRWASRALLLSSNWYCCTLDFFGGVTWRFISASCWSKQDDGTMDGGVSTLCGPCSKMRYSMAMLLWSGVSIEEWWRRRAGGREGGRCTLVLFCCEILLFGGWAKINYLGFRLPGWVCCVSGCMHACVVVTLLCCATSTTMIRLGVLASRLIYLMWHIIYYDIVVEQVVIYTRHRYSTTPYYSVHDSMLQVGIR